MSNRLAFIVHEQPHQLSLTMEYNHSKSVHYGYVSVHERLIS